MVDVKQLSGQSFRGWRLREELGRGDSAIVYAAQNDEQTNAAIKIFFPDALAKHGYSEEEERLELQLRLKGKKQHPNLVEIYEGGVAEELGKTLFLIMERVPGQTLDKVIDKVPRSSIGPLIKQLAEAARFLESVDLVHRDIKPANIVVSEDFSHATLLDFGIVMKMSAEGEDRLSGDRFVATLRYSPPEFVWRSEAQTIEAWRAITFYQLGAVLHDLIMSKQLFQGMDQPSARLYDSIKLISPVIESASCEDWLVVLAKCCLVKDWRERISLVSWDSFLMPNAETGEIGQKQLSIRLRQVRRVELEIAQQADQKQFPEDKKIQELWDLQDKVFLDIRRFLTGAHIFPRFSTAHSRAGATQYLITFDFERAPQLGFNNKVKAQISLDGNAELGESTELMVTVSDDHGEISKLKWVEVLTVDSASSFIQQALLQMADKIVPQV